MDTAPGADAQRLPSWYKLVVLGLLVVGAVLRLRSFCADRSLWLDEAMLALNITRRSLPELAYPLSYMQAAPIGFLFLEKLAIDTFGNHDFVLRLVPLGAGIASLALMYKLASACVAPTAAVIAVGLFALSERLVYFSTEVKPYATDVLWAMILYVLAYSRTVEDDGRRAVVLGIVGAVALWFSYTTVFILGGIGLGLLVDAWLRKDRAVAIRRLVACGSMWAVSFAVVYVWSLRRGTHNADLLEYWGNAFMPMPPWAHLRWVVYALMGMLQNPLGLTVPPFDTPARLIGRSIFWIGCLVYLAGCASLLTTKPVWGVMLLSPIVLTLLASGFHAYPFAERLLLFTVPAGVIALAEGMDRIRMWLKPARRLSSGVCALVVAFMFYSPLTLAGVRVVRPNMKENIKPVMQFLQANTRNGDAIYVYYGAQPAFEYYASFYEMRAERRVAGIESRDDPTKYLDDLDRLRGRSRVWVVFSHDYNWGGTDEQELVLQHLDRVGTKLDAFGAQDASTYLYDLS